MPSNKWLANIKLNNLWFRLYQRVLSLATHPYALFYLVLISFSEAIFSPIPPDVLLVPMVLERPKRALKLGLITTLSSISGGILGYAIGRYAFDHWLSELIQGTSYWENYQTLSDTFQSHGFWGMVIASFLPIPYKMITITAGAIHVPLGDFIIGSLIGRSKRFIFVALLVRFGGKRMETLLLRYVERLGWLSVTLITGFFLYRTLA